MSILDWLTRLTRSAAHQRAEPRTPTRLPVKIDHMQAGVTRDVSIGGAYFETDLEYKIGSAIELTIELEGMTSLECVGKIVRVEPRGGGKIGIAVKITQRHLKGPGD
jgi:hypothetical protein